MLTLGIETSCDETAAALVKGSRTLSSVVATQHDVHARFGGVVPEIASRAHLEALLPVLQASLKKAGISLKQIDLVTVSQGPGLMGSLLVGLSAAKALSLALKKPLVGVDHVMAHLYAGFLSDASLRLPCLC
jgi:N6-L-threonylcarbamoyladenine synthase